MMPKRAWGLEISQSSIKAVLLEKDKDALTLATVDVEELPRGVSDQAQVDANIRDGLAKLTSRQKIKGQPLACSLPGHTVFNRLVKLPPGDLDKIGERVRYEAQQQIPFPLNEVVWDFYIVERKYAVGEEMEVILFAIKRDVVDHFLAILAEYGLRPQFIQFSPVALYNYLIFDQDVGNASLALDLGSENTDLVVLDGPRVWIRNLPITGGDLTKAVQRAFNIPLAEAEKRKVAPGDQQQAAKVFAALQGVFKDLVSEIHRSIGHYKSVSRLSKFDKIFLMGNGAKAVNFQKFVSQNLQIVATRVSTISKATPAGAVDQGKLQRYLPTLGPALGLSLHALGETRIKINLLPEEERVKREQAKRQPVAAAAVVLLALPVYMMWSAVKHEVETLRQIQQSAEKVKKEFAEKEEKQKEARAPIQPHLDELDLVANYVAERDLVLKVLNAVNGIEVFKNNAPSAGAAQDRLWILNCEMHERTPGAPAAPGQNVAGAQLRTWPSPAGSILAVKIEGAIPMRGTVAEAELQVRKLLGKPIKDAFATADPDIRIQETISELKPMFLRKKGVENPEPQTMRYHAFTAGWEIKLGEEARKPPAAAPPAGAAPPPTGGAPPSAGDGANAKSK